MRCLLTTTLTITFMLLYGIARSTLFKRVSVPDKATHCHKTPFCIWVIGLHLILSHLY